MQLFNRILNVLKSIEQNPFNQILRRSIISLQYRLKVGKEYIEPPLMDLNVFKSIS